MTTAQRPDLHRAQPRAAATGRPAVAEAPRALAPAGPLVVLPALPAGLDEQGRPVVTRKMIEGAEAYARAWPGRVVVVLEPALAASSNLDNVVVDRSSLAFELHVLPFTDAKVRALVEGAAVVLSTAHVRQDHVIGWCRAAGVPIVLNTELSLRTRWQIARNDGLKLPRLLRRLQWEAFEELRLRRAMRQTQGVQCAGTPTHEAYRGVSPDALLYFDSRTGADLVVSASALENRLERLMSRDAPPLRLAFSGRLVSIKGVQHLPALCRRLLDQGLRFDLRVFGDGALRPAVEAEARRLGVQDVLRLEGVLDYASELVPRVSSTVDLFVCPHVQGDPSCTYLETLACGVPIAGFANEAWAGMLRAGVQGWSAAVGDVNGLADLILQLDRDRAALARASRAARVFGLEHSFERTFQSRIDHLARLARVPSG